MTKAELIKDWEDISFEIIEMIEDVLSDEGKHWRAEQLGQVRTKLQALRDKQLKTFPKLERK